MLTMLSLLSTLYVLHIISYLYSIVYAFKTMFNIKIILSKD